jgi:hypothetical protein
MLTLFTTPVVYLYLDSLVRRTAPGTAEAPRGTSPVAVVATR